MAIDVTFFKDLVDKHNDQKDTTRIVIIQGNTAINYVVSHSYNPDGLLYPPLEIVGDDLVWREQTETATALRTNEIMTCRTGLDVIDYVRYYDVGDELDRKTGKRFIIPPTVTTKE